MSSISTPVFMHLLADRALKPGAAWLVFDSVQALQELVAFPEFKPLAASLPCLIEVGPAFEPALLAELQQLGCKTLQAGQRHQSDAAGTPVLPAGAAWLDGNWYQQAPAKPNPGQAASRMTALKLVELVNADADTRELEDVFRQDPALSYQLLRLVNSLAFGAPRRITSFSQAILMLGRQQLKRWINLMLFAANGGDQRSPMLLARVSLRARSMELLAREAGLDREAQDLAFMAGMFSLLGVLFGLSLADLFKPLQLPDELVNGVLHLQGPVGSLLTLQQAAERLDRAATLHSLQALGLDAGRFNHVSLQAWHWMLGMGQEAPE